ncbi:CaiB/BaiF CoA transferase family protein [Pseudonocardia abyssalis]|uniref:CoA transferase n=1 Tax=Pseudonocardia abyssalis TaxID=2792008 RepID=A0ABS6USF9_9PSEU|nr:CaiB/BaiF CoA-transferase family protein [Pseudonocardia abyssalis]MBW0117010.1 CoA transferase [Pseudonocardia abyssalis]MBW0135201.1 CoA transferase [Pseudonocardia abyssalis]
MTGPLTGITVVALEQAVSAPLASRTLGDLGARVIKIENPRGGDFARHYDDVVRGSAAHFVWVNRGKESVTLDLKDPRGLDLLHRLLDRADALVSNLAPGAADRLGVGPDDLAERHPHLVAVEISGYGPGGPLSDKRAYDLLVQAESGACSITGTEGAPAKAGPPVADTSSGLYAAIAVLAGLFRRQAGGPGGSTHVAMLDVMTELMGYALTHTQHSGVEQQPQGMGSPAVVPYGAFATADGHTVVLGTTNDAEWRRLARDLLSRPDLADDPRYATAAGRVAHRAELDALVAGWCTRTDLAEIQAAADAAGIGNARHNTTSDVLAHPHLAARGRWGEVDTPGGPVPALLPPLGDRLDPVPALGEHTGAVLRELGVTDVDIAALRADGVI